MVTVVFPDRTSAEYEDGVTPLEVAKKIGKRLADAAIAAVVDGNVVDLSFPLRGSCEFRILTESDKESLEILRHSASHVMADAVMRLFPGALPAIGPAIEDGFYYDFDVARPFTPEDLEKIEEEMRRIVKEGAAFTREEATRADALKMMESAGQKYKVELLQELQDRTVSLYRHGKFVDLCRGPHLPATAKLKFIRLLRATGAYWRGDEKKQMLQRLYGTAFFKKEELEAYLERIEEAKRRDHRKLGRELDLFSIHEESGPGLVFWHPKGAVIRNIIETFWRDQHVKNGYELIYSPHIAKVDLWKISGHWDFYRDSMYSPMDVDGQNYVVKPMNCPGHILVYKTRVRSYRELPLRWAELGTVYRYERSGVVQGLLRVRGFTQDDAHIFCRLEELEREVAGVIEFGVGLLRCFGFSDFRIRLSTRPEKYVGTIENWDKATSALKAAIENLKMPYEVAEGEAVFYGPKADIDIKDCLGRAWQCFTVQVDFNMPERFDMKYTGEDGREHRPIMVHRALLGSMERFFGVLVEHYAGAFPMWLAPVQTMVIPIGTAHEAYAKDVQRNLVARGVRAGIDLSSERISYKIREATMLKVPYMLVIGDKEVAAGTVSVRERSLGDQGASTLDVFFQKIASSLGSPVAGCRS
ncbi:MAG: threonine--tRNA ligase [Planctomycetota bacterium]|nr:threonine--tRNA ligase [Planctomycetota bacterium]